MAKGVQALLEKAGAYLPPEKVEQVREAYEFAERCHAGQRRLSGEPFIVHPLETALILADLCLDADTLRAGLLHDVMEDCRVPREELEARFGPDVARLVDGVTKLTAIEERPFPQDGQAPERLRYDAESLRKMLLAMARDIRVVLIKLADRLHNMRTLDALPPERRRAVARETLDIYAPLAHRLGIWDIKWRLEDLAFRHLYPEEYRQVSRMVSARRQEREAYIQRVSALLKEELERAGIPAEVYGRPKHLYSIYRKMQKYASEGKPPTQIYDLYALRVLVNTQAECYHALGVVHNLWHPLPGTFDDYIANPKENGYQSLHTTVLCEGGTPLEVQIRTYEMHQRAEYGVAAHWRYKEGKTEREPPAFEQRITWLRHLLEWQREIGRAEEFVEQVRTDLFQEQVFVYTPKGDIVELPAGSTPIDFAYRIHTELGHRTIGAKVNGRLVPLNYRLRSGDTVEILTSRLARGPSLDWLNPDLGYVRTASARQKIRQWFRRQERTQNIQRGREVLQKELRRLGLKMGEEELARRMGLERVEDLLLGLGTGSITPNMLAARLAPHPAPEAVRPHPTAAPAPHGIQVLGVGDLLTRLARCCAPLPGDPIVGFVTRSRGVTVHRRDCPNIRREDEQGRLVPVAWGPTRETYPVRVRVEAWDRVGLLRDLASQVSEEGVNIANIQSREHPDGTVTLTLTLFTTDVAQLHRLMSKMEAVKGVTSVERLGEVAV